MELWIDRVASELGQLILVGEGDRLCALDFEDCETRMMSLLSARYDTVQLKPRTNPHDYCDRLQAYLKGDLGAIAEIPVSLGGTTFQRQVWSALRQIPPGTTLTYGELATQLGKPTASRAVGLANSQNPVAIVVPCHRVIGATGALTGYAGGTDRKHWLLTHEGVNLAPTKPRRAIAPQLEEQLSLQF